VRPPGAAPNSGSNGSDGRPLGSEYTLHDVIGHGSMAEVYRAVNRDGDPVAVKVLRSELGSDAEVVSRFIRERSILTGLNAPNVVRVRDLVAEGGTLAIVMDLVDGPDLRAELLRRRTLPTADAVQLAVGVLRGLAAVHAAGVIHRDIKPENILLTSGRYLQVGVAGHRWPPDESDRNAGVHGAGAH
jgi:serine/threonine-protein kinase